MSGWIKLYRDINKHWIWKSQNRFQWWIDILITVNHSDSKVLIRGKLIECKRGQSVMSLETWGNRWNVTKKTVKDFFELLQKDSMLVYENIQITTRITVCNYECYQSQVNGQETETGTDSKRTVNGDVTQTRIIKNDNNNTWRNDFKIYISECKNAYKNFMEDSEALKTQQRLNPGINVKLSIEKGFTNFWGTEAGWKHKKKSRTKDIDWKSTIVNSITLNKVYDNRLQKI